MAKVTKARSRATAVVQEIKRERIVAGHSLRARIFLNNDNEGLRYGPNNNPKRGECAYRFALMRHGITIGRALDAGVWYSDIADALKRGFIRIEGQRVA